MAVFQFFLHEQLMYYYLGKKYHVTSNRSAVIFYLTFVQCIVSQAIPHLFEMLFICLFSDLKKSGLICVMKNKTYK